MFKDWVLKHSARVVRDKNPLETILGAAILLLAMWFFLWGIFTARTNTFLGYELVANFATSGGVIKGAEVAVAGVKIGRVDEIRLNQEDYSVDVVMYIERKYKLPKDSVAKISSNGLIGDKLISIEVGNAKEFAADGNRLRSTPYKPIEEIIGDFIFKEGH